MTLDYYISKAIRFRYIRQKPKGMGFFTNWFSLALQVEKNLDRDPTFSDRDTKLISIGVGSRIGSNFKNKTLN